MGRRLIDADKLIELIDDDIASLDNDMPREGDSVCRCTLKMVKLYIKSLPTVETVTLEDYRSMEQTVYKLTQALAEAEPEHGRWLPSDKGDCTCTCSECGFVRDAYILEEKAYCPRCGAKMKEE